MAHLHVKATVADYDEWKADFEGYHTRRAEHGGTSYQLFRATDDPDEVVVLIEFDDEASARSWTEYLDAEGELTDPEMTDVELTYLELVEHERLASP
jgi:heme-degrading monooxygenase HmoA